MEMYIDQMYNTSTGAKRIEIDLREAFCPVRSDRRNGYWVLKTVRIIFPAHFSNAQIAFFAPFLFKDFEPFQYHINEETFS